jgi:vesicle coat complex subunit
MKNLKLKYAAAIATIVVLSSCTETISTADQIQKINAPDNLEADGTTVTSISADLNNDLDTRNVLFKADNGSFPDNKDADSIIAVAEKINGQLKAIARFKSPAATGNITLSAQVVVADYKGQFVANKTITTTQSVAKKIELTANSFSVYNNFEGEITLTGNLSNENRKGVSKGYKVKFDDVDKDFKPMNGYFRNNALTSDASSKVSTIYSPGFVDADQSMLVIVTVLDDTGVKTTVADTLQIAIIHKN